MILLLCPVDLFMVWLRWTESLCLLAASLIEHPGDLPRVPVDRECEADEPAFIHGKTV
jgi:hypothetical protein